MTDKITLVCESIQGDEHTTASFRTIPEIMADVSTYDPKELLVILFDHMANFVSVGSGSRFNSVRSLAISLCPFRPTVGAGSYIETSKFLHSKEVLNIQNLKGDYCILWCIHVHIRRVNEHAQRTIKYTSSQFPLKFSDTPKFENLKLSISINVFVIETNYVIPLYASKHLDRKHYANLLLI